ncbi:MAG: 5-formyltetrahydrofolate cyclo-ligase [Gammaproteobacteria bacterium]|nr:5-formyltetrahydrofolate cyclo-ligase [Gammaproteobacteria bacterium]MDH5736063.1 5-formyltetrahydrofolate cyclo-ligase [Gammaproteobacteria bacterium]
MPSENKNNLRNLIRQNRRQLDFHQQDLHAWSIAHLIIRLPAFRNAKRIACYLAEDGEIDPVYIIEKALQFKKQVYLPILPPTGKSLFFAAYNHRTKLKANQFGILEPDTHPDHWLRARDLSLILLPLVAFDENCNRLGMGGGYYDRSLAFTAHRKQWHNPRLIGLAHELQKVDSLSNETWDIPLNMIATEEKIYFNQQSKK